MTSAAQLHASSDLTDFPHIVRRSLQLGVGEAVVVLAFSLASRFLEGSIEFALRSASVLVGLAVTTLLPGLWTRARTIEGIAGAAGIGLGAAAVYLVLDVVALVPLGTYTNRWYEIGGGSNWWYHPVWWMVGTYLPWMGAYALANQTARTGAPSPGAVFGTALVLAGILAGVAILIGFPGARLGLPAFAIAYLPALLLTVLLTGRGGSRR
jgi:hypothetical protein